MICVIKRRDFFVYNAICRTRCCTRVETRSLSVLDISRLSAHRWAVDGINFPLLCYSNVYIEAISPPRAERMYARITFPTVYRVCRFSRHKYHEGKSCSCYSLFRESPIPDVTCRGKKRVDRFATDRSN